MRYRRWLALPAVLLVLAGGAAASFGPLVRRKVSEKAERLGAHVDIGALSIGWGELHLRDVHVKLDDLPSSSIVVDEIVAQGTALGELTSLTAVGGVASSTLEPDAMFTALRALSERLRSRGSGSSGERKIRLAAEGWSVSWKNSSFKITGSGVGLVKEPEGWILSAEQGQAVRGDEQLEATGTTLRLQRIDERWTLGAFESASLSAIVRLSEQESSPSKESEPAVKATPEPEKPVEAKKKKTKKQAIAASAKEASALSAPALAMPTHPALAERVREVKDKAHRAATLVSTVLEPGASLQIGALKAEVHRGNDVVHVGPASLRLESQADRLTIHLLPSSRAADASPLRLEAEVPFDASRSIDARLTGGPVTLAMLGMHDQEMGLLDVAKTTIEASGRLVLSGDGGRVEGDLRGQLKGLSLENARLSNEPVRGLDLAFSVAGAAALDGSQLSLDRGELELGTVHAELSGLYERQDDGYTLRAKYAVPLAGCQSVIDSVPAGLLPKLRGVKMTGTFALNGKVNFESKAPQQSQIELNLMNECRVASAPPDIHVGRLRQPFRRMVYDQEGRRVEIESGPGTPGWVSLAGITPYMEAAVLTTEDGGFRRHKGFDLEAIRNSIRENLKAGRFVRGASTISMQTAKNIYLERDKTLSRKLQEAFLTAYLEQELSKEQILELYLNSIEFGPMIYGIHDAAEHYFKAAPSELSLGQALYLASILPNPKRQYFDKDGNVSASHMRYLQRLMRGMAKRHLIRDDELQEGLTESVQFGVPKPPKLIPDGDVFETGYDEEGGAP